MVSIPSSRVGTVAMADVVCVTRQFPSPQVGSEQVRFVAAANPIGGFHPLKSGRNMLRPPRRCRLPRVSIPSSRVGTLLQPVNRKLKEQFPSPQVGSERCVNNATRSGHVSIPSSRVGTCYIAWIRELIEGFPSPQVGSEPISPPHHLTSNVSIPSSRVGTDIQHAEDILRTLVSIPSSRVGTNGQKRYRSFGHWFPSPQVGSERIRTAAILIATRLFPSPQVGSELAQIVNWLLQRIKFPSPQVGSEPTDDFISSVREASFHPLKSGRNSQRD